MRWLKYLVFPIVVMVVLMSVLLARMNTGKAFAASSASTLANCGQWSIYPSPNPGTNNVLDGVAAITDSDVWSVGYTDNQTLTEHWNGSSWSVIPSANASAQDELLAAAAISTNDVWAVGSTGDISNNTNQAMAEQWNGTAWNIVAVQTPGVSSLFTAVGRIPGSSNVWAVGHYDTSSAVDQTLIEQWNGTSWSVVPSPNRGVAGSDLLGVTALSANNAWAVGTFGDKSGNFEGLIEQWNGHVWKVVTSPVVGDNGVFWSVTSVPGTQNVWAAGTYFDAKSGFNQTLIAYWNGQSWSLVSSPNVAGTNNILFGIASANKSHAWAVGLTFGNTGSINHALTEFWNGKSWSIVSSPDAQGNSELNAVTHVPQSSAYWAVGNSGSNGSYSTVTERYCS